MDAKRFKRNLLKEQVKFRSSMILPVTKRLDGLLKGPQDNNDDLESQDYKDMPKKLNQLINKMTNELV